MSQLLSLAFAAQVLRIAVPYVLAALGGTLCERSGVVNIALEGLLLVGAFGAAAGSLWAGASLGPAAGIAVGVGAAVALAALYGLAVLRFRADAIVSGVAVTLLASGGTRFLLKALYGSSSNSPRIFALEHSPLAARGGLAGFAFGTLGEPLLATTLALVLLCHVALFHTRFGLRLRAAGEHPEALEALGLPSSPLRWAGVLLSGALAGLGGVWLAYDQHKFVGNMSAGRGFIALAAMILGGWTPLGATAACLLFALAEGIELRLQSASVGGGLLQALPYVVTVVALGLRARRQVAPRALGKARPAA